MKKDLGHPFINGTKRNVLEPINTRNDGMMVDLNLRPEMKKKIIEGDEYNRTTKNEKKAFKKHKSFHKAKYESNMNSAEDKAALLEVIVAHKNDCRFNIKLIIT